MPTRLAVLVSHPIQHFGPWHRELASRSEIDLRVFFCCDWGVSEYTDHEFGASFKWDVPLLEGYSHEFLPVRRRPDALTFRSVDNPAVANALERFDPHVLQSFGYAYRTNWRATSWAHRRRVPVLIYSDSSIIASIPWYKRLLKDAVVASFYRRVDGAFFVGDNNRAYHERYGIPEERLFPGMYPVDCRRLLASVPDREATRRRIRERHGIPQDAFVAVQSGKYSSRKRPLDLVAAAHAARLRGLPVWVLLVGEGPERAAIEAFCREEGVENAVLTGFVNQSAIADYYCAADALVVGSDYDPHPLVVTEGACFGLPIVASDAIGCVGPNDTARPGVNAIVYPCGDRPRLEATLSTLGRDPDLRQRMSLASEKIGASQDAREAATALIEAVQRLRKLGPR